MGILPLVERECHHWTIPLVERNVYQVGMLPLVERECHQWMLPLVERNVHQGLPFIDSGDHDIPLVESGDQGTMDTNNHICLPLVERYCWNVLHVWLPY